MKGYINDLHLPVLKCTVNVLSHCRACHNGKNRKKVLRVYLPLTKEEENNYIWYFKDKIIKRENIRSYTQNIFIGTTNKASYRINLADPLALLSAKSKHKITDIKYVKMFRIFQFQKNFSITQLFQNVLDFCLWAWAWSRFSPVGGVPLWIVC